MALNTSFHRIYRVPGFLYSHLIWVLPTPHPQVIVAPPLWVQGGDTLACGGGGGRTQFRQLDRKPSTLYTMWTDTLVLYVYYNLSTPLSVRAEGTEEEACI